MSHVATVEMEIKDLDALRAACKAIGVEFREGQRTFRWFGQWVNDYSAADAAYKRGIDPKTYGTCEHAISVPGNPHAYEVGVVRTNTGKLALAWDFYAGGHGLMAAVGPKAGKLVGAYATEVAKRTLFRAGYTLGKSTVKADGTTEVVFNKL